MIATGAGRLTAEPTVRQAGTTEVATFDLACDGAGPYVDGKSETGFFRVEMWGKMADTAKAHFKKGTYIQVSGQLIDNRWVDATTDPDNPKERRSTLIKATWFKFGPNKKEESTEEASLETADDSVFSLE